MICVGKAWGTNSTEKADETRPKQMQGTEKLEYKMRYMDWRLDEEIRKRERERKRGICINVIPGA